MKTMLITVKGVKNAGQIRTLIAYISKAEVLYKSKSEERRVIADKRVSRAAAITTLAQLLKLNESHTESAIRCLGGKW